MKHIALPTLTLAAIAAATYTSTSNTPSTSNDASRVSSTDPHQALSDTVSKYYNKVSSPVKFTPACTGGTATFDLNGIEYSGTINVVQTDVNGQVRIGGDFSQGTFCFAVEPDSTTTGIVVIPSKQKCYLLNPTTSSELLTWKLVKASEVMCTEMPVAEGGATDIPSSTAVTTQVMVPILHSKSDARTVLFLDFMGGKVQDPLWNGGRTIDAKPANYTVEQMRITFDVVAERYAMFNVNVTTDLQAYLKAPIKSRMRVILTPSNFIKGYSGFAYTGSLSRAGSGVYAPNIVCWVFTNMVSSAKNAGEVCAHELGHTFGLSHDRTTSRPYYTGHGRWAPVMGSVFGKTVIQWSKGEYANANNTQDDTLIISNTPGVGLRNTITTSIHTSSISTSNIICKPTDVHRYDLITTRSGTLNIQALPSTYSGVDLVMELRDKNNNMMSVSNASGRNDAFITQPVTSGTYQVIIRTTGDGDPRSTGYSAYGSLGSYNLVGGVK